MCDINLKFLIELEWQGEDEVIKWLIQNEFIPCNVNCPKCGKPMRLTRIKHRQDGYLWTCRKVEAGREHYVRKTVRENTCFSHSNLKCSLILQIIYLWVKNCMNQFIVEELHINTHAIVDWKRFCREVCMEMCNKENMFGGPSIIIEFIQTEFNIKASFGNKKIKNKYMCGAVERGTNNFYLKVVPNHEEDTLLNSIQENILPGSVIFSDSWKKYNFFNNSSEGFQLNQNYIFKNPQASADLEIINSIWNSIKDKLQDDARPLENIDLFLAEYVWKKRHEGDPNGIFISFIKAINKVCNSRL